MQHADKELDAILTYVGYQVNVCQILITISHIILSRICQVGSEIQDMAENPPDDKLLVVDALASFCISFRS